MSDSDRYYPVHSAAADAARARYELGRRLRQRRRRAEGLDCDMVPGTNGRYNIPQQEVVNRGVETKRASRVKVTLPKLRLPE